MVAHVIGHRHRVALLLFAVKKHCLDYGAVTRAIELQLIHSFVESVVDFILVPRSGHAGRDLKVINFQVNAKQ